MSKNSKRTIALLITLTIIMASVVFGTSVSSENENWIPLISENWDNISEWSVVESAPTLVPKASYLHLYDDDYTVSGVAANPFASNNIDVTKSYTVEFRAKVNNFTYGPGGGANKDCNSLAVQVWPKDKYRFMFTIEDGIIKTSNSSGTWSNTITLPVDFDATDWHTYKLIFNTDSTVSVWADDKVLGTGEMQNLSWGNSGFKIYAKGHADSGKNADSYIDCVKIFDHSDTIVFSDDFGKVNTDIWGAMESGIPPADTINDPTLGNLLRLCSADYQRNGLTAPVALGQYDRLKVSFSAKITDYSSGHGSGNSDYTTLGLKLSFGDKRLMFAVENNHIDACTSSATWGFDADISGTSEMQNYTLYIYNQTSKVDIYVNDVYISSTYLQSRSENEGVELFCRGRADDNISEAFVSNLTLSYAGEKGLAYWTAKDYITVKERTSDGFTINWPEALFEGDVEYIVYIDSALAGTVSENFFTFTGLDKKTDDYVVTVKAQTEYGVSPSTLTAFASPVFYPESNQMDIKNIIPQKTKYSHYRIPGIVVTKKDSVIVYYEGRTSGSDWASMDIIAMRSTDGGETFSSPYVLVDGTTAGRTVNNPVITSGSDGILHLLYCVEYGICTKCNDSADENCPHGSGVFYKKSIDDGLSWSEEVNITAATNPETRNVIATGPGHGLCLKDGTLIVPVWYVPKSAGEALSSHDNSLVSSLYSTDNGLTWKMGETLNCGNATSPNETAAAETSDGGVIFYVRTAGDKYRALAYSPNGYSDWSTLSLDKTLIDPTCFGSIISYSGNGQPHTLLSVNCESQSGRENIVVKGSSDDGKIWNMRKVIADGGAGYSDIAIDSKGTIYVLYEEDWGVGGKLARLSFDCFANKQNTPYDTTVWSGRIAEGDEIPTDKNGNGYLDISTSEQLAWLTVNGGKAELTCDIWINDMVVSFVNECAVISKRNGEAVTDISTLKEWFVSETDNTSNAFGGKIELKGNGHTVNGLFYSSPVRYGESGTAHKRYGLFPAPADGSRIEELGIENSYMLTDSSWGAACIAGQIQNRSVTIEDCYVADSVYHSGFQVAAIIGGGAGSASAPTTVRNCYSMAHLRAESCEVIDGKTVYSAHALTGNTWDASKIFVYNCYVGNGADAYRLNTADDPFVTAENVYFGIPNSDITLENMPKLADEHWYAVDGRTPVLRARGCALGDADSNGKFEAEADRTALRKSIINNEKLLNGDINRDNRSDICDLVKLHKIR